MNTKLSLSDVREVTLHWVNSAPTKYLIAASEVDTFVEASKRLHFNPGINPHNGESTAKIWKITAAALELRGPFWWTVPDLQNNGDPRGAKIIEGSAYEETKFIDLIQVNRWKAEEAEAEAASYRKAEREAMSGDKLMHC